LKTHIRFRRIALCLCALLPALPASVHAEWEFVPSFVLTETYDSNVFSEEVEEEDFVTQPGVDLVTRYLGRTARFQGRYSGQGHFYTEHDEENQIVHEGGLELALSPLGRTGTLTVRDDFTYTPRAPGF
jgi:hypothetical protein